jgi:hypothetical protein
MKTIPQKLKSKEEKKEPKVRTQSYVNFSSANFRVSVKSTELA